MTKKGEALSLFLSALPALGTPVVILGGIYSGIFSPTESAGVCGRLRRSGRPVLLS